MSNADHLLLFAGLLAAFLMLGAAGSLLTLFWFSLRDWRKLRRRQLRRQLQPGSNRP